MKTKKTIFLLAASFCCFLLLMLNGCHSEKVPDLAKFNSYLKIQQETFKQQMKQVEKQYPMVALAFTMQEAAIAERPHHQLAESVISLTGSTVISHEPAIRYKLCLNGLFRDLARSQTYEDGLGAFNRFHQCLSR